MKKTLKNIEMVQIINGIQLMKKAEEKTGEAKLSLPVNFALNRNLKALMIEAEAYETCRSEIIRKYELADHTETTPKNKEYMAEMERLLQIPVEVEIREVDLTQLEDCKNLLISEMELLDFMIKE